MQAYADWLGAQSLEESGEDEVRRYLVHLQVDQKLKPSNLKLHTAALKYVYREVLGRPEVVATIPCPHVPPPDIEVLTESEVDALFEAAPTLLHKTVLMTAYSAGLRVGEVVALQVEDIDSRQMVVRVRRGKGAKPRTVMLSQTLLVVLRDYWSRYRPARPWLFASPCKEGAHISIREVQRRFKQTAQAAGIRKKCSMHSLRHAFATHLLEDDVELTTLQALLGHRRIRTTVRYVHLRTGYIAATRSPLDRNRRRK